ncbi:MAG: cupin domain-containing protein [SAR202 cluster bacterium]|nr:cupin domain-containing protein [SAR202 cluster bacterium]|tara:strand:- start:935 stop:1273 length:339 start_codon:yes stop_codon:yes gene_type:complete
MSYFTDASKRETKTLVEGSPGARTQTFWGENMLLSLVEVDANGLVPLHTHPHEQGGIIVEGELEMGIDGEVKLLKPGDMYIIPGNVEHYAKAYDKKAVALDIFSPVREEFKY